VRVIAVPVKSLSKAKTRLAPILSPLERAAVTLAMLEDVLDATLALPGWETWVVSPDEAVLEVAARRRARPVAEEKPPLSAAVRQVELEAVDQDADATLTVLLADLPFVTTDALQEALQTLGSVVIAPSQDGTGTNLLLRRPPRVIGARFGRDSFARHQAASEAKGLPVSVVRRSELTADIDTPKDVLSFLAEGRAGRTRSSLLELHAADRLAARR
jgi:2-phospho-L-lactate/phosphoenolpyruvate guanylyltransferase